MADLKPRGSPFRNLSKLGEDGRREFENGLGGRDLLGALKVAVTSIDHLAENGRCQRIAPASAADPLTAAVDNPVRSPLRTALL